VVTVLFDAAIEATDVVAEADELLLLPDLLIWMLWNLPDMSP
jgi:hypothetical protein